MSTKEDFWERKKKLNDDFFVLGSVGKPATESQILAYGQSSGYILSEDFKDFLLAFGSLIFEVKEEVWKRPDEFDVYLLGNSDTDFLFTDFHKTKKCLPG